MSWLKARANLPDDPTVARISRRFGWPRPDAACGPLLRVWRWAGELTANGTIPDATLEDVDAQASQVGFGQAMVDARWLGDYKVWLEFNDGRKGVVDLADELHGEELEPLRDRDRFCQFYLDYGLASIAWLDGQDFTPEFLYEKLKAMH